MKNLVIYRIPDEDGTFFLREHDYIDGKLSTEYRDFTVLPEDWYTQTKFCHIILAEKTEDGGSTNALRYAISATTESHDDAVIHEATHEEIEKIVGHILANDIAH